MSKMFFEKSFIFKNLIPYGKVKYILKCTHFCPSHIKESMIHDSLYEKLLSTSFKEWAASWESCS